MTSKSEAKRLAVQRKPMSEIRLEVLETEAQDAMSDEPPGSVQSIGMLLEEACREIRRLREENRGHKEDIRHCGRHSAMSILKEENEGVREELRKDRELLKEALPHFDSTCFGSLKGCEVQQGCKVVQKIRDRLGESDD